MVKRVVRLESVRIHCVDCVKASPPFHQHLQLYSCTRRQGPIRAGSAVGTALVNHKPEPTPPILAAP
jgi:hypothetical protein